MSRPSLSTVKDAIVALLAAGLPAKTELLVNVDPATFDSLDLVKFPRVVVLTYLGGESSENLSVGNPTQEATWSWAVDIRAGGVSNNGDTVIDESSAIIDAVYNALWDNRPTTDCGWLIIEDEPTLIAYSQGIPVYRFTWQHETSP